jgi:hypothetical protein
MPGTQPGRGEASEPTILPRPPRAINRMSPKLGLLCGCLAVGLVRPATAGFVVNLAPYPPERGSWPVVGPVRLGYGATPARPTDPTDWPAAGEWHGARSGAEAVLADRAVRGEPWPPGRWVPTAIPSAIPVVSADGRDHPTPGSYNPRHPNAAGVDIRPFDPQAAESVNARQFRGTDARADGLPFGLRAVEMGRLRLARGTALPPASPGQAASGDKPAPVPTSAHHHSDPWPIALILPVILFLVTRVGKSAR